MTSNHEPFCLTQARFDNACAWTALALQLELPDHAQQWWDAARRLHGLREADKSYPYASHPAMFVDIEG